jgi:protein SDA1
MELDNEDNDSMWQGWDIDSDSSEESDSEDWINVDDDESGDLVISDSDDEGQPRIKHKVVDEAAPPELPPKSTLATTKVYLASPAQDKCNTDRILH